MSSSHEQYTRQLFVEFDIIHEETHPFRLSTVLYKEQRVSYICYFRICIHDCSTISWKLDFNIHRYLFSPRSYCLPIALQIEPCQIVFKIHTIRCYQYIHILIRYYRIFLVTCWHLFFQRQIHLICPNLVYHTKKLCNTLFTWLSLNFQISLIFFIFFIFSYCIPSFHYKLGVTSKDNKPRLNSLLACKGQILLRQRKIQKKMKGKVTQHKFYAFH